MDKAMVDQHLTEADAFLFVLRKTLNEAKSHLEDGNVGEVLKKIAEAERGLATALKIVSCSKSHLKPARGGRAASSHRSTH